MPDERDLGPAWISELHTYATSLIHEIFSKPNEHVNYRFLSAEFDRDSIPVGHAAAALRVDAYLPGYPTVPDFAPALKRLTR